MPKKNRFKPFFPGKNILKFFKRPLRQRLQSLPAHIPTTILRESRILLRAAVPASAHQRYGSQKSTISRKIATQP